MAALFLAGGIAAAQSDLIFKQRFLSSSSGLTGRSSNHKRR
jgi:hypothetical protein